MTVLGATSPPRFPIGHPDYLRLRRGGLTYIDKTRWVADTLDDPALVTQVVRPRRFGKTLDMTTLRYFVERTHERREDIFADTAVWAMDGGRFRSEFQRYPLTCLSFKDLKRRLKHQRMKAAFGDGCDTTEVRCLDSDMPLAGGSGGFADSRAWPLALACAKCRKVSFGRA